MAAPTFNLKPVARLALAGAVLAALSACTNLAPDYQRPNVALPDVPATEGNAAATARLPGWQALVQDDRLRQVVELALKHNADLRVAVLNVEKSRAQLRLTDADRWPTVNGVVSAARAPNSQGVQTNTFQVGLQVTSWEVDLLGRVANLSEAASATLLGTEAAQRSARLALVSQTISAWLTLAADGEQLALADKTLQDREATQALSALRYRVGAISELDWRAVQALTAAARSTQAQARRQRAQDENALHALVGATVPANLLPPVQPGSLADGHWLADVPAGMSSDVLLARPDVIQAEQQLRAANANIGAARAAVWPRITLSGSAGTVSNSLSDLFSAGTFAWSLSGQAAMALFDYGRNEANVKVAQLNRDAVVVQYQKAVQTAFKEAADGLAGQTGWREQLSAQRAQLQAEAERHRLSQLKYQAGAASLLDWLDAERSLASAQQALVQVKLAELLNRVALYKALGGDETHATATPAQSAPKG